MKRRRGQWARRKRPEKNSRKAERGATLKRRIDNLIERLEYLESTMGSASTPNLTGLPGGGDGTSKTEREVAKKLELETQLRDLIDDEGETRKELERMIGLMKKPDEQTIIEMRYFDEASWWTICAFGPANPRKNRKRKLLNFYKQNKKRLQNARKALFYGHFSVWG